MNSMSGPPPVLEVRLSAGYGRTLVIHEVEFKLEAGDALGLVGTSGAGKTTLVLALLGLLPWRRGHADGEVLFEGVNLLALSDREARRLRGNRFALVPQSPMTSLNSALSLRTHFEEAWRAHQRPDSAALTLRIEELLEQMQLPGGRQFLLRKPQEISVGQAQRVLIALALLHRPALLIADEPTSALDPVTQAEIVSLFQHLNEHAGTTLLYISHDLTSTLQLCRRLAVLDRGRIAECLAVDRISQEATHPATLALLHALPAPPEILRNYRPRLGKTMPEQVPQLQ